jgi:hypothetical protein
MEKKYIVKVINVFSNLIAVDANNEDEAREKAKEIILNKQGEGFEHMYESTLPTEHWAVITQEDFDKLKEDFKNSLEPQEESKIITP